MTLNCRWRASRFVVDAAVLRGRPVSCRQACRARPFHVDRPSLLASTPIRVKGQDDITPTMADSITVRPDTAPGGRRRSFAMMLHAPGSGIVEALDYRCVATMPH